MKSSESILVNKGEHGTKMNTNGKFTIAFRKSLDSILNQLESCESSLNAVKSKFSMSQNDKQFQEKNDSKTVR